MEEARLVCQKCFREFPASAQVWRCTCGGLLDINYKASFDIKKIQDRPQNLWRYREAIPIEKDQNIISFQEGFTSLLPLDFDGRIVHIKQDHLFPSASYKDRGATVLISKVVELGINHVVEDSSGNAGSAVAAYCARANIDCDIFVPGKTSSSKTAQIKQYGASLHLIPGSREDTARAVMQAAEKYYYASHSWNPYFFQGTKTFAYEVWEQLGFCAPDALILPAGNGTLLLGAYIGFADLLRAGKIKNMPKLFGVQASNCAPLYTAFLLDESVPAAITPTPSLAEGIAITNPVRGAQMLKAVRETDGAFYSVSETEIKAALFKMHSKGFYIEPTAAATIAAIPNIVKDHSQLNTWVSVFTGHGLKTANILDYS